MRTVLALAAGLWAVLATAPALAQGPSYEKRGYGGPLYVGPNFEKGGQHAPPDYSVKPLKKRVKPAQTVSKGKAAKEVTEKDTTAAKPSSANPGANTDGAASTPAGESPAKDGSEPSATAAVPSTSCKRFDPTSGQTITVPCE